MSFDPAPKFFPTVYGLCSGTAILKDLFKTSPVRAILRLLMLMLLCSLACSILSSMMEYRVIRPVADRFHETAGDIIMSENAIAFSKTAEQPRIFKFPRFLLGYYPGNTFTPDAVKANEYPLAITVLTGGIAIWTPVSFSDVAQERFYAIFLSPKELLPLLQGQYKTYSQAQFCTASELVSTIQKKFVIPSDSADSPLKSLLALSAAHPSAAENAADASDLNPASGFITIEKEFLVSNYMTFYGVLYFVTSFLRALFTTGITIVFITLIQLLYSGARLKTLNLLQSLTLTVYSTFPALLSASIYSVFELPWISYNTVFFILFLLYQFFGFNTVMRSLNPANNHKN